MKNIRTQRIPSYLIRGTVMATVNGRHRRIIVSQIENGMTPRVAEAALLRAIGKQTGATDARWKDVSSVRIGYQFVLVLDELEELSHA